MGKWNCLLLEDNAEDALLIQRTLRASSNVGNIQVATDKRTYSDWLKNISFDCLLVDYTIPGFNGLEALDMAKAVNPDLPIVVVSGHTDNEIVMKAIANGAADYVFKDRMGRLGQAIDRAVELRKARAREMRRQRLEDIGALAAGIAHDQNNALAPIAMALPMLRPFLPADKHRILNVAELCVKRAAEMQQHILTFIRGGDDVFAAVNLNMVIRQIGEFLKHTLNPEIVLTVTATPSLPTIHGNHTQIEQALMNLCVNSRDALANTIDPQIAITAASVDGFVRISITDNGPGIPPETIERIWEPFFTTKPFGLGTGLGLSQVKTIIKSHGGQIAVASRHHWTQFVILLPSNGQNKHGETEHTERMPAGNNETVLVVDDEAAVLELVRSVLENYGYKTLTAQNAVSGMEIFKTNKDSVFAVLTDLYMPCIGGSQLIAGLRSLEPSVKIIVMTGTDQAEMIDRLGVDGFLKKPYTTGRLLQALEKLK